MLEAIAILAVVVAVHLWQTRGLPEGAAPPLVGLASDGKPFDLAANYSRGSTAVDASTAGDATTHPAHGRCAPACGGSPSAVRGRHGDTALRRAPTLVVFWASWCPVCKAESGNVARAARHWPVASVAMQSGDAATVAAYLAERGETTPAVVDADGRIAAGWNVAGVPTHYIVDADGKVRFRVVGYATTAGLMARLWWAEHVRGG